MFIQTEQTPNPATLKFLPGRPVMTSGTANFTSEEAARISPLAERLFSVAGSDGGVSRHRLHHRDEGRETAIGTS